MESLDTMFSPLKVGNVTLKNRMAMAPMPIHVACSCENPPIDDGSFISARPPL